MSWPCCSDDLAKSLKRAAASTHRGGVPVCVCCFVRRNVSSSTPVATARLPAQPQQLVDERPREILSTRWFLRVAYWEVARASATGDPRFGGTCERSEVGFEGWCGNAATNAAKRGCFALRRPIARVLFETSATPRICARHVEDAGRSVIYVLFSFFIFIDTGAS